MVFLVLLLQSQASSYSWMAPAFTKMDSLFIISATGEPRFKRLRDSCEKILVTDSGTPHYLLTQRLTGQTPRQRHYVEHLFTLIADSGHNVNPAKKIASALPAVHDSLKPQLLHIGSELGDSAFLPIARLYLRADSEEVRKSAIRSLGLYPKEKDLAFLFERIAKTQALERQGLLWALSCHGPIQGSLLLLPLFNDENLYNRQLARKIISVSIGQDWPQIEKRFPQNPSFRERLEWVLLAMDIPGLAAQNFIKRQLPILGPAQQLFLQTLLMESQNRLQESQKIKPEKL